ncbi:MAG: barA [Bacteroidetes bacterium]|nr:barA [Bacteroidota bacterium]
MNKIEQLENKIKELEMVIDRFKDVNISLKETFDSSQIALEIYDNSGKLVDCNPACLSMFGVEDINQVEDFNLFDDPNIDPKKLEMIKNEKEIRFELLYDFEKIKQLNLYNTSKSGLYLYDCIVKPISNNKGYLAFIIDITKSKETENNLTLAYNEIKEKREILKSIIESTKDFIWTVDPVNYSVQSFNSAIYNYFLKERNIILKIGDTPEILVGSYSHIWVDYYKRALKYGHIESDYKALGGDHTLHLSFHTIYKDNEVFGISVFGKDISSEVKYRKEILEKNIQLHDNNLKLKESETLFKTLSESSQMGIILYDINGTIYVNNTLCYLSGYSQEEFIGKSPLLFIHPDDRAAYIENLRKRLEGGISSEGYEIRGVTKSGEIRDILVIGSLAKIDGNQIIIGNITDITEKKKSEIELIKAKEKAEESDKLIVSFLQNMSHEIKTPLNSIIGFSQLVCDAIVDNKDLELYSNLISENSEHLVDIINDVIEMSNIYTNDTNIEIVDFDFFGLIDEIKSIYLKKAEGKGLSLISNIDITSNDLIIQSDKQKIKTILSHLISNSIKFTNKGKIDVYSSIANDSLEISVIDTGIGISDEHQKIIFEPFRQIDSGANRTFGGNGLGMHIVKSFIDLLNGHIEIKSELGKGTTVKITIPLIASCHN